MDASLQQLRVPSGSLPSKALVEAIKNDWPVELGETGTVTIEGPVDLRGTNYSHPLIVRNTTFNCFVDARDSRFAASVDFSGSTFQSNVDLSDVQISGSLHLSQVTIRTSAAAEAERTHFGNGPDNNLEQSDHSGSEEITSKANRLRVEGLMDATELDCDGTSDLGNAELKGGLEIRGVHIKRTLNASFARIGSDLNGSTIRRRRAEVEGSVDLGAVHVTGSVVLKGVRISSSLRLHDASVDGWLDCQGACLADGTVRTEIDEVNLRCARILSGVSISGALIRGRLIAPWLETTTLLGSVDSVTHCSTIAYRGIVLNNARISGHVDLQGAWIGKSETDATAFRAEFAVIDGNLLLKPTRGRTSPEEEVADVNFEVEGDLNLVSIKVGGDFYCGDDQEALLESRRRNNVKGNIVLEYAQIGRHLILSRSRVDHALLCFGAQIGGIVQVIQCWLGFVPPDAMGTVPILLDFRQAKIAGDLQGNGFIASVGQLEVRQPGNVNLQFARVGGNVSFTNAVISGSLDMDSAKIAGALNLSRAEIDGDLSLRSAHVQGEMFGEVKYQTQTCPDVNGKVLLSSARLASVDIYFHAEGTHPTEVDMVRTQVDKLSIGGVLPPKDKKIFSCNDLQFEQIELGRLGVSSAESQQSFNEQQTSVPQYLDFLAHTRFSKSIYLRLEAWLRNRGEASSANKVYLAMRRWELRGVKEKLRHPLQWASFCLVGDGVRIWPAFIMSFGLLVCSWVMFLDPKSVQHPLTFAVTQSPTLKVNTPLQPKQFEFPKEYDEGRPDEWGCFDAFWMSVRMTLPMIDLIVRHDWEPSRQKICIPPSLARQDGWCIIRYEQDGLQDGWCRIRYDTYASIVAIANWLLIPLILGSLLGLLKKDSVRSP